MDYNSILKDFYLVILAILYKVRNLIQMKQFATSFCMSSRGNIPLGLGHRGPPDRSLEEQIGDTQSLPKVKKIITWNTQELWWYCYKGSKINNIIDYLIQSDADVICLQEVFEVSSIYKIIYEIRIHRVFPYFLTGDTRTLR